MEGGLDLEAHGMGELVYLEKDSLDLMQARENFLALAWSEPRTRADVVPRGEPSRAP